jgi:hypothetical protein
MVQEFNQMEIGKIINKMEWWQPRHLMPKEQKQLKQIKWHHELWQHTCARDQSHLSEWYCHGKEIE